MKSIYNKKLKCKVSMPETVLEAVESLQEFFEADMWYTKNAEWKTEKDMLKYLQAHFNICKKEIKKLNKKIYKCKKL